MTTIYLYIAARQDPHPITGKKCLRGRMVLETGEEVAELYAHDQDALFEQAKHPELIPKDHRVAFVEEPARHPVLSKILAAEEAPEGGPPGAEFFEPENLELLHREHHLCGTCLHEKVCAVATHPLAGQLLLTIAGCRGYSPGSVDTEDSGGAGGSD